MQIFLTNHRSESSDNHSPTDPTAENTKQIDDSLTKKAEISQVSQANGDFNFARIKQTEEVEADEEFVDNFYTDQKIIKKSLTFTQS